MVDEERETSLEVYAMLLTNDVHRLVCVVARACRMLCASAFLHFHSQMQAVPPYCASVRGIQLTPSYGEQLWT